MGKLYQVTEEEKERYTLRGQEIESEGYVREGTFEAEEWKEITDGEEVA